MSDEQPVEPQTAEAVMTAIAAQAAQVRAYDEVGNHEEAHCAEDGLFVMALRWISQRSSDPQAAAVAKTAIEGQNLGADRWYV